MPAISACPRCQKMVTIPQGLDSTDLVRCPLCGEEYPLQQAMELIPPELIRVVPANESHSETPGKRPLLKPIFPMEFSVPTSDAQTNSDDSPADHDLDEHSHFNHPIFTEIANHARESQKNSPEQSESTSTNHKQRSTLHILLGSIISGLLALSLTYVALAWIMGSSFVFPAPPKAMKPVLRYVLPDNIWHDG
ncbi:MAG: hypothetical protein ACWGMZ_13210 [Thermoguttaceae bacterium]